MNNLFTIVTFLKKLFTNKNKHNIINKERLTYEVKYYPRQDFRLVSMYYDNKTFYYSIVNGIETFEVYFNNCKPEEGYYYSRAYKINNEKYPKKYNQILNFLINELNKIDWDTLKVAGSLTKLNNINNVTYDVVI